jgi:ATP-binding cassette subfamily B protein
VLNRVSFTLPAGRTLGIVGASGSGKSTVTRLLVRLLEPSAGRVLIGGIPVQEVALASLRQSIAIVPQDAVLLNDTIGYNIGFGREAATAAQIERAAQLARLDAFIASLPEGFETAVGERGLRLSGGERQRVAIARAAIRAPGIYVFDEATSSLDGNTERDIMQSIRELSRGCTTVIVAHRLSTVAHADEILVLEQGDVVERGTHASLLAREGPYARLWQGQQAARLEPQLVDA